MRKMAWFAMGGLALLALGLPRAVAAGIDDEAKKLASDYDAEVKKFNDGRAKGQVDATKHPALEFLGKFQDLAAKGKKGEAGADADLWILQNYRFAGANGQKALEGAVDDAIECHLTSPKMEAFASNLRYGGYPLKDHGESALRKIVDKAPVKAAKASAMFSLAAMLCDGAGDDKKKIDEAGKMLKSLAKDFADTPYAAQAKGYLFEIEHLQIGMTAPEFTAKDQDDKAFKLSEYRGKVVVVDFWGFW